MAARSSRHPRAVALALVLGLLAAGALAILLRRDLLTTAQAAVALGPLSGWRCARDQTFGYDPRMDQPDRVLLGEPVEPTIAANAFTAPVRRIELERVEADLHGGDTIVRTRAYFEDGGQEERVYVLAPGSYRHLTAAAQSADQPVVVCTYDLRAWRVVVEQALG